jgi:VCBS repeat protein
VRRVLLLGGGARRVAGNIGVAEGSERHIRFVHHNGAAGNKWYPELFGGGVAVLDIDGDARPDLLFVNGKDWQRGGRRSPHRLYRNNRDGTFRDVLAGRGLDAVDVYGLGATVADYDNDGRDDVLLTTVDGGRLFHNEGERQVHRWRTIRLALIRAVSVTNVFLKRSKCRVRRGKHDIVCGV